VHSTIARAARAAAARRAGKDVFVLPASTPGSLGDAAMLCGLQELLGRAGHRPLRYFGYRDPDEWVGEMAGGSAGRLPASVLDFARFPRRAQDLGVLYVNGADVLDGKYSLERSLQRLHLAKFVAELGRPVTITGFSLREDLPPAIALAFRALPHSVRLCARDPRTHARLATLLGREAVQVADLAFLMKPHAAGAYELGVLERLQRARQEGKRLIGFCLNLHAIQLPAADDAQRAEQAVQCMTRAWQAIKRRHPDSHPVVLPHDFRGRFSDVVLGERFVREAGLADDTVIRVDRHCSAQALKSFCATLDVLVTGRMHCGIAALGGAVPVVFFNYQGKVDGLLEMFGLHSSVDASGDPQACAGEIERHVESFVEAGDAVKEQIVRALPAVCTLAAANVQACATAAPERSAGDAPA
jgi:polysaccharide pyruvyl transferase WcaK-like protein